MKVLCYCPSALDGTAYWRVAAPFGHLRKMAGDFSFTITEKIDHNQVLDHDVLLLQRPFLDEHVAAAQIAKLLGRKIWCDWDDDILGVPSNNGRVMVYQRDKHKDNVRKLAASADAVTVTCEALASRVRPWAKDKIIIVPNALDPLLTCPKPDTDRLAIRRIAWRGGDSHNEDLLDMGDAMCRVAQETEGDTMWHFVGFNPYWLLNGFPSESVKVHTWLNGVITYFRFIGQLAPSVLAVPLSDTPFNRAKSNISVLEAAWMGALPVAPKWLGGCDLPGVLLYENKAGFESALLAAARMPEDERRDRVAQLRATVARDWMLDTTNLLRALVLKRLTGKRTDTWANNSTAVTDAARAELHDVGDTLNEKVETPTLVQE